MRDYHATDAEAHSRYRVLLFLASGDVVERDLSKLFRCGVFRRARREFARMHLRVDGGLAWPNGADICPDVLVWGGAPPRRGRDRPPRFLAI